MIHLHSGPFLVPDCDLHLVVCDPLLNREAFAEGTPLREAARLLPDQFRTTLGTRFAPGQVWIVGYLDGEDGVRHTIGTLALERAAKKERLEGQCLATAIWISMLTAGSGFCPRRSVEIRSDKKTARFIEQALLEANLDIEGAGDYWLSTAP